MKRNIISVESIEGKIVIINIENILDELLGNLVGINNIKYISEEIRENNKNKDLFFIREIAKDLYIELIRRGKSMEYAYNKTLKYIKGL